MKKLFRWINPLVFGASKTPCHWLFSHQVMVLQFKGRRSGKPYAIPVSYMPGDAAHGRQLLCMTDMNGLWWKNLVDARCIQVTHRGKQKDACVRVVASDLSIKREALAGFCRRSRASAFFSGVGMKAGEPIREELTAAAEQHVLIELTLAT
ncbi:MAG: hypothetical protein ISP99_04690 [Pseudomonadales bacterium]|nr:hypothetical protein [Pseudomonadales bacterium]MBL6813619.1 hypothetical protein [Pseudomonadales bacterium]